MPDEAGSGEKVYPASPRKRREARKHGQVARSPDLSGALVLLAMTAALRTAFTHGVIFTSLTQMLMSAFTFTSHPVGFDMSAARNWQIGIAQAGAAMILPALLAAVTLGVLTNVVQVGLYVTPESLVPDFTRLNPVNGIKRILSAQGVAMLAKGLLKMGMISWICWTTLQSNFPMIEAALQLPMVAFLSRIGDLLWFVGIHVSAMLFILALADYSFQKYQFEKSLRMTREEMKQEIKQTDGDPLIRQKIRQKQRAMAQRRMMQQVPKATVVITNPTHFAVALRYDKTMTAPTVVARGQDLIALAIKEIARDNKVPLVENRPVARALYYDVRLGDVIPPQLYKAVAEILAFVYRGRRAA
jgi:flagellar biosynthesis protein FlhB